MTNSVSRRQFLTTGAAVVGTGLGVYFIATRAGKYVFRPESVPIPDGESLIEMVSISQDGRWLCVCGFEPEKFSHRLYVGEYPKPSRYELLAQFDDAFYVKSLAWSPTRPSHVAAVVRERRGNAPVDVIYVLSVDKGEARRVCIVPDESGAHNITKGQEVALCWSSDGRRILLATRSDIVSVVPSSGEVTTLYRIAGGGYRILGLHPVPGGHVRVSELTPDLKPDAATLTLATLSDDGTVLSRAELARAEGHIFPIPVVGASLYVYGLDAEALVIPIMRVGGAGVLAEIPAHDERVGTFYLPYSVSPDDSRLLCVAFPDPVLGERGRGHELVHFSLAEVG